MKYRITGMTIFLFLSISYPQDNTDRVLEHNLRTVCSAVGFAVIPAAIYMIYKMVYYRDLNKKDSKFAMTRIESIQGPFVSGKRLELENEGRAIIRKLDSESISETEKYLNIIQYKKKVRACKRIEADEDVDQTLDDYLKNHISEKIKSNLAAYDSVTTKDTYKKFCEFDDYKSKLFSKYLIDLGYDEKIMVIVLVRGDYKLDVKKYHEISTEDKYTAFTKAMNNLFVYGPEEPEKISKILEDQFYLKLRGNDLNIFLKCVSCDNCWD